MRADADQILRLLDDTRGPPLDNNVVERALRMVKIHDLWTAADYGPRAAGGVGCRQVDAQGVGRGKMVTPERRQIAVAVLGRSLRGL
jgi:hypothetical protein